MFSFTQLIVSMKRRIFHRFKLCTFATNCAYTGSRNGVAYASNERNDALSGDLWRWCNVFYTFYWHVSGRLVVVTLNVKCWMLDVTWWTLSFTTVKFAFYTHSLRLILSHCRDLRTTVTSNKLKQSERHSSGCFGVCLFRTLFVALHPH